MLNNNKTLVVIIGHKDPHFLADTAESIKYYNKNTNYEIVFAIDFNKEAALFLEKIYGKNKVFVTKQPNGWGRGILKTIIHALDYFSLKIRYRDVITMDCDALCVGPFIDFMVNKAENTETFFSGQIWHSPSKDHGFHYNLRASGFMNEYPFNFKTEMAAGPCMLWSSHCFKFLKKIGLYPSFEFDKKYHMIHFAHDQLSTWLNSCGVGHIDGGVGHLMEMKWRESLPTFQSDRFGQIPITYSHTAIIHPTMSNRYTEDACRGFFRERRKVLISTPHFAPVL